MNYEIKVSLFDKINTAEQIAQNSYKTNSKNYMSLNMTSYFCNDSFVTLLLNNDDKKKLRAMDKINVLPNDYEEIIISISRVLGRMHMSWLSYLNSLLYINKAIRKLRIQNPDVGKIVETWLGFHTSPSELDDNFSFVHLSKDYPPAVCLMIAPNVGMVSLLSDKGTDIILSLNNTEEFHPIKISSILAPMPDPEGQFISDNGAVKSTMVSELLVRWTGNPGIGNFYPSSVPSTLAYATAWFSDKELLVN